MSVVKQNLAKAGIKLPPMVLPLASYTPYVQSGNLLFISGQLPKDAAGKMLTGQLGADVQVAEAQQAARWCGVNLLSAIQHAVNDDWSKVRRVVKLTCFVNSAPQFKEHHLVANGVSDLMGEIFGKEVGTHARSAVGVSQLPLGVAVEVEAIIELNVASSKL
ncbi:YjgF/chorismate_mutase-like, putative endoribonuclease/Endoribonuclease L-PSP, putative [Angomonas deanei]|uniref:YjgF/chorismate_mutase-like, putative endoribonuclease/Endoribonuclease L-PSP, putative n=1 Tax=Angomonas deanei TaxID=59799 RepID=A0A7G2C6S5_9TRYP|nr:YjgF/chorismate_mutase-like, putative endoribonuclease/Endoribonuclease L-PSP, putative [Angomonas deanei]